MTPTKAPNKTFAEFFAGVGLVAEGLRPGGWTIKYANDIDPKKQRLYEAFHGPTSYFHRADIWQTESILDGSAHRRSWRRRRSLTQISRPTATTRASQESSPQRFSDSAKFSADSDRGARR
jgi:site-specific DNA-cytosine methylase